MAVTVVWEVVITERGKSIDTVSGSSASEAEEKAQSRLAAIRELHPAAIRHDPISRKTQVVQPAKT